MKRLLCGFAAGLLWSFFFVNALPAQMLITGKNGGKGSQAVMVSANATQPTGSGTLSNFWVRYGYGVSDRVAAFVA